MRTSLFILGVLFFIACNDGKLEKTDQLIAKSEVTGTTETEAALQEAIKEYVAIQATMPDTKSLPAELQFPRTQEEFDELEFHALPLYKFDYNYDEFLRNPSPEQLQKLIQPAKDEMIFLATKDGRMVLFMGIKKFKDGKWRKTNLGNTEYYFKRDFSQLPELLEQVDGNEFACLNYFDHLELIYKINGETFYAGTANGKFGYSEEEFVQKAASLCRYGQKNKEELKKIKGALEESHKKETEQASNNL